MSQFSKKRIIIYSLLVGLMSFSLYGCNSDDAAAADAQADPALENAVEEALNEPAAEGQPAATQQQPEQAAGGASADEMGAPNQQAVAERSPVEITRIEVDDPIDEDDDDLDEDEKDPHEHEPTPNLFKIDECQVEVQGIYQVKLSKDLLKEINSRRKDYGIGQLTQNTSLLACSDARCKEQTYFVGHFRPDGSSFDTVSPEGYVRGECIAVEYRTVKDIMEAWFAVNKSRMQIMDPDYTQCGISIYDIDGQYFIAAEFGY